MAKLQPAVQTLHYRLTGTSQAGYIDLSESVSIANRRFYRQGLQWAVSGISIYNGSAISGRVLVEKVPTTWPASNAWHKAFAMWKKQQDEAIADSGSESAVAKFRDFKVYADATHYQSHSGGTANLLPQTSALLGTGGSSDPLVGEWQYSRIVIPNSATDGSSDVEPSQHFLYMVGANGVSGAKGIIDGYQMSRSYPQSPDPVSPSLQSFENWMNRMFNVGNDNPEVIQNAVDKNDDLPYDQDDYPGSENQFPNLMLHDMIDITATTVGGHSVMKGGVFPCGLIKVFKEQSAAGEDSPDNVLDILVHLVPGKNRGYLAEPMQDM